MLVILGLVASGCVPHRYYRGETSWFACCLRVTHVTTKLYSYCMSSSAQLFMKERAAALCNRWGRRLKDPEGRLIL